MKIALIILHADPARGGAETYTVDLAHALVERGHEVSMLACSFGESLDQRVRQVKISAGGATRLSRYLNFLDSLDSCLAGQTYDVIHAMLPVRRCDLYHPHAGIAAEAIRSGHLKYNSPIGRAVAGIANRLNRKRQRFAAVERALLTGADHRTPVVICLSEYVKTTVRRHFDLPDQKLATLINAVDLKKFDPQTVDRAAVRERLGLTAEKVVALMVAQDFARKGLGEAIDAWKEIDDERLVLLVVGKDDFSPYQRRGAGAKFPDNLIYAGPTRDVRSFYAAADLFVLPTRHDPCSLVVLEALAMGLPVISTVFNGACEVMVEGVHGSVLPDPADIGALATTIRALLNNNSRRAMHESCLQLRPRLAYEHHIDQLLELYQKAREA